MATRRTSRGGTTGFQMQLEGYNEFLAAIAAANRDVKKDVSKVMKASAKVVADDVKAPRDTGVMAATVRATTTKDGGAVRMGYKNRGFYSAFVHLGVPRYSIAPRPIILEAKTRKQGAAIAEAEKGFSAILDKYNLT